MKRTRGAWLVALGLLLMLACAAQAVKLNNRRCYKDSDCLTKKITACYTPLCIIDGNPGVGDDGDSEDDDDDDSRRRGHCDYIEFPCADTDPCTINERCEEMNEQPVCVSDPNPDCQTPPPTTPPPTTPGGNHTEPPVHPKRHIPICQSCCDEQGDTVYAEKFIAASLGDGVREVVIASTGEPYLHSPLVPGAEAEGQYIVAPGSFGYDIELGSEGRSTMYIVGDSEHSHVRWYDARTHVLLDSVHTVDGVGLMDYHLGSEQLWVVGTADDAMMVVSPVVPGHVINASVPLPADLVGDYEPHDVVVGQDFAIVSLIHRADPVAHGGYFVRYSTSTFLETGRLQSAPVNHMMHDGYPDAQIVCTSQAWDMVLVVTPGLDVVYNGTLPGAHGLWVQGDLLYVTDHLIANASVPALFGFNVSAGYTLNHPLPGSPYALPVPRPHNPVLSHSGNRLFITHTDDAALTHCAVAPDGSVSGCTIVPDMNATMPRGVARFTPRCDCEVACFDGDPCTIDTCSVISHISYYADPVTQCQRFHNPNCVVPEPFCPKHSVNLTVTDYSKFEITRLTDISVPYRETMFEFCMTKTIQQEVFEADAFQLVLGFDEYAECRLNERGTCDNLPAVTDAVTSLCAANSTSNSTGLCRDEASHMTYAFTIPGFPGGEHFVFSSVETYPPAVAFPEPDVAHVHGEIAAIHDSTVRMRVDLRFSGAQFTSDNPYTPMNETCYEEEAHPFFWNYYTHVLGTVVAQPGTPLIGLYLGLEGEAHLQIGLGANGRSLKHGAFMRANFTVLHQPLSPGVVFERPPGAPPLTGAIETPEFCSEELDYCDLFVSREPANGWELTYPAGMNHTLRYCRNYTLSELLQCRPYGLPHEELFVPSDHAQWATNNSMLYRGRLYATVPLSEGCDQWVSPNSPLSHDGCQEITLSQHAYDISFNLENTGELSVVFQASRLEFDAIWMRNIWTCENCLQVVVRTITRHQLVSLVVLRDPSFLTVPWNATIALLDPGQPGCLPESPDNYCYQDWVITSLECADSHDHHFEGSFQIRWLYGPHDSEVEAWLHVDAQHHGPAHYLNDTVQAHLTLYTDHLHCDEYDCGHPYYCVNHFEEGDHAFARLSLHNYGWLEPRILRVYIGYWDYGANVTYYDEGVERRLIYDLWEGVVHDDFHIVACHDNSHCGNEHAGEPSVCFSFRTHRYGDGQFLHVVWEAIGDGGATIEGFVELRDTEVHPDDPCERRNTERYVVDCNYGYVWDYADERCEPDCNEIPNHPWCLNGDDEDDCTSGCSSTSTNTNTNTNTNDNDNSATATNTNSNTVGSWSDSSSASNANSQSGVNVDNDVNVNVDVAAVAEALARLEQEEATYIRYFNHYGGRHRPPSSFDDYDRDDDDSDGWRTVVRWVACILLFVILLLFLCFAFKMCCCRKFCVLPCYAHWKRNCRRCKARSHRPHRCRRPDYCEVCAHTDSSASSGFDSSSSESDGESSGLESDEARAWYNRALGRMVGDTSRTDKEAMSAFLSADGGGYYD